MSIYNLRGITIKVLIYTLILFPFSFSVCQITFPVNGIRTPDHQKVLLTNATIHGESEVIENGSLLIQDGLIVQIGKNIEPPIGAIIINLEKQHIYPAFVDPICDFGMPEVGKPGSTVATVSTKQGAFAWNEALKPEVKAFHQFTYKKEEAEKWKMAGFGALNCHVGDGLSRGTSTMVLLSDENEHQSILKDEVSHVMSFSKGNSNQEYPNSLMGAIALIRQTYYDGQYYDGAIKDKEINISLAEWNRIQFLPQIFIAQDKLDIFRIVEIGKEFNKHYLIKSSGDEYQRVEELKALGVRLIIPLEFPQLYEVEDPYEVTQIELSDLKHWELASSNAAILHEKGVPFIFTSQGLKDKKEYLPQIRKCIKRGLPKDVALFAMTLGPAKWLQIDQKIGSIQIGKIANLIICSEELFEDKTQIREVWVMGKRNIFSVLKTEALNGVYILAIGEKNLEIEIKAKGDKMDYKIISADTNTNHLHLTFQDNYLSGKWIQANKKAIIFSAYLQGRDFRGKAQLEDGSWSIIEINYKGPPVSKESIRDTNIVSIDGPIGEILYPFLAFGNTKKPIAKSYLIKNATVWTCENEGKLENTDVLIRNGKIEEIGRNLKDPNALIIQGKGKHLTPGIIDEHSHIAISRGVNECTQASTAEVRIGDVINSEDINIYRQLAGGVTTAQLLHGSCNPVGGQSAIIKLKWGYTPSEMKIKNADEFIKFALGENVKRSGAQNNPRYPDSRMGVEQIYEDIFTRAKEYDILKGKNPLRVRKDLELDAISQIINHKRFITCHSYVQSEINMLMKLADRFGFTVNTFTHILEGYKVADKMKKHGAGAAGFSDWWAYKFEVYEAIPYNGAILHDQGVVTAFNSDDAEMGRRLNQEAGKAVMYGNVQEEEALKFVTLNPAKLLHLDKQTGSIKVGKDADVVLWNANPLSIYAKAEMTFVEGILFYDVIEDLKQRNFVQLERARIIQKMIRLKQDGVSTIPFQSKKRKLYHCDSIEENYDFE